MALTSPRIAIGSIFIECNQLGGVPTGIDCFERSELNRGPVVLQQEAGVGDIAPLTLEYEMPAGCVPLRLTMMAVHRHTPGAWGTTG